MRKLTAFIFTSLDGYYKGQEEDISWHGHGTEENEFAAESLDQGATLLFGRKTYELMEMYWPTPMAKVNDPTIADGMNSAEKIVFSKTMKKAGWQNTRVANDLIKEIQKLKNEIGKGLTVLGSGEIVCQLTEQNLIDEYQVMVDPVILGQGYSVFQGLTNHVKLKLTESKTLTSGVVLLSYKPLT